MQSMAPNDSVPASAETMPIWRKLLLALVGFALCWVVIAHSLTAYLAGASPASALLVVPDHSLALVNSIERRLRSQAGAEKQPAADLPAAAETKEVSETIRKHVLAGVDGAAHFDDIDLLRQRLKRALSIDPMSPKAKRLMGQLAELDNDPAAATYWLKAAARGSKHEQAANFLLMLRGIDARDWTSAMYHADVLMRSSNGMIGPLVPIVTGLAEVPEALPLVVQALAAKPSWRPTFMYMMLDRISDPMTPLKLFQGIRNAGSPATDGDIAQYLSFLVGRHHQQSAYYAWIQLMPPERLAMVRNVYNGDFEIPPGGVPFDWSISPSSNAIVEIVDDQNSNRALRIDFLNGFVRLGEIKQQILLGRGEFVLSGRFRGTIKARRGVRWIVTCNGTTRHRIAEGPAFGRDQAAWARFEITFKVPENCSSQVLSLILDARFSSEQLVSGTIWFDDIAILRKEGE